MVTVGITGIVAKIHGGDESTPSLKEERGTDSGITWVNTSGK